MLTMSQVKTYEFIKKFIKQHQHSPTAAEIAEGIGIQSRGVVHRYLKALVASNYIRLTPHRHRNIELNTALDRKESQIPLIGCIAAGHPIEAIGIEENIDIQSFFAGSQQFALRVKGNSMMDEGIMDGDLVICESSQTAHNGQIVVALIDNAEATLKRIRFNTEKNTISLIPANAEFQTVDYPAERIQIQGIYRGLIRKNP